MTQPLPFITSPLLSRHGIVHGFSTRIGGVSEGPYSSLDLGGSASVDPQAVETNHHRLADALGVSRPHIATAKQVHGNAVVLARIHDGRAEIADAFPSSPAFPPDAPFTSSSNVSEVDSEPGSRSSPADVTTPGTHGPGFVPSGSLSADALVASPGAVVGVRTADCVPTLLFDRKSGIAAAVHAGWRGTVARVVVRTIEAMSEWGGTTTDDLVAAIGPAIGRCCFEVSPELGDRFLADADFGPSCVERKPGARPHVDLVEANARLLIAAGLRREAIDRLERCTVCEPELFFSHRRDKGVTGRHLSVIGARV